MRLNEFLTHLEGVRKGGEGYTARCPAHEDKKNSLGISVGENGHILLKCFVGCQFEDIVKSLNLELADLMPEKEPSRNKEIVYKITPEIEHVRVDEPGGKKFFWRRNGKAGLGGMKLKDLPLYQPPSNIDVPKTNRIFICEGEKAAMAAARLGCVAYGTVSGASSCPGRDALMICENKHVVLWADNDPPGRQHMAKVRQQLKGIAQSVTTIATGDDKDDAADFKGTFADIENIINQAMGIRKTSLIADKVDDAINSLWLFSNNDHSDRIPTGINKLDYSLRGGMMNGALYLLGAPSGHGKTTLLQCIAVNVARQRGPILFVSPEMSGIELAEREAIRTSGVSINQIAPSKNPNYRIPDMYKIEKAADVIKKERLPIHIVDDTDITMSEISKLVSKIENIKLVIVDYAQEIADRASTAARYLAVGEVGKEAIILGKEFQIPVLVASQVNVFSEGNEKNYAFRETKDLEHRAHCSMIMEVKRSKTPNMHGYYEIESTRIFARKNRSGAVFSVDLEYDPALFSIKNKTTYKNREFDYGGHNDTNDF